MSPWCNQPRGIVDAGPAWPGARYPIREEHDVTTTTSPLARAGNSPRRAVLAIGLAALGLLAVACSGEPGRSAGPRPPGSLQVSEIHYAACMRSHGVPNFPDPSNSGAVVITPASGIDMESAQFQAAERACQRDAPQGGAVTAAAVADEAAFLKFSVCMHEHGYPGFPEPKIVGSAAELLSPPSDSPGAWDPGSPLFQAAWKKCAHYTPGGRMAEPPANTPAGPGGGGSAGPGGGVA
jgi:hypothetical protein